MCIRGYIAASVRLAVKCVANRSVESITKTVT